MDLTDEQVQNIAQLTSTYPQSVQRKVEPILRGLLSKSVTTTGPDVPGVIDYSKLKDKVPTAEPIEYRPTSQEPALSARPEEQVKAERQATARLFGPQPEMTSKDLAKTMDWAIPDPQKDATYFALRMKEDYDKLSYKNQDLVDTLLQFPGTPAGAHIGQAGLEAMSKIAPIMAFTAPAYKKQILEAVAKSYPKAEMEVANSLEKVLKRYPPELLDKLEWVYIPPKEMVPKMGYVTGGPGGAIGQYFSQGIHGLVGEFTRSELLAMGMPKAEVDKFIEAASKGAGYWTHPPGVAGDWKEFLDTNIHEGILHHLARGAGIQNSDKVEKEIFNAAGQLANGKDSPYYEHLLYLYNERQARAARVGKKAAFEPGIQAPLKPEAKTGQETLDMNHVAYRNTKTGEVLTGQKAQDYEKLRISQKLPLEDSDVRSGWNVNGKFYQSRGAALEALEHGVEVPPAKAILGSERGSTGNMFRSFVEFWDPLHSLPQKEDYLALRYKTLGTINRVENLVNSTWEKLRGLSPSDKQDIFKYLDGQITKNALPQHIQATANNLRTTNNLIGKMLVDRGLLSYETYVANKDQYIRYMYLRHVLDSDKPLSVGPNGKMDLNYLKSRKDLTTQQRKALGLIEDVSVAEPMTMSKSLTDVAKFDNLLKISLNDQWTWQPSLVKVGNRTMGIGQLAEEIEMYQKMLQKAPNSPEIRQQLISMQGVMHQVTMAARKAPEDFVQLSTSKAYGPLAGAFVRKEIAKDITPVMSGVANRAAHANMWNTILAFEEKGMAAFKVAKTALNLPTAFRNTVSNVIQLNMSGMNLAEIGTNMVKAAKSMLAKDVNWGQGMRNGLFKTNWAEGEINEVLKHVQKLNPKSYPDFLAGMSKLAGYYGKIDDLFKLTKYISEVDKGTPTAKAIQEAQKWGMDYSLADPAVKLARRHVLPFFSYQYKIAPLIAESIAKRPWVIAKYLSIPVASYEVFKQTNDITSEQWERMKKKLPSYIKEQGAQMVLPFKDKKGNWQWINLEYFFPWQQYKQVGEDVGRGELTRIPQEVGISHPMLGIAEALAGADKEHPPKDPFSHREIYSVLDPPKVQAAKFTEWIYNQWAPAMLTRFGAAGYTLSIGDKTRFGHEITPGEAGARWLGVNVTTISPQQKAAELAGKKRGLKDALNRIMRDPTIEREKKQQAIKQYRDKLREAIQ